MYINKYIYIKNLENLKVKKQPQMEKLTLFPGKNTQQFVKHGGGSVMVWESFAALWHIFSFVIVGIVSKSDLWPSVAMRETPRGLMSKTHQQVQLWATQKEIGLNLF